MSDMSNWSIKHYWLFWWYSLQSHFVSYRFAPTRAPAPWDDVKTVDQMGPVCPQRLPDISNETLALEKMPKGRLEYLRRLLPRLKNQSEDCLYMNIYTPVQGKLFFFSSWNLVYQLKVSLSVKKPEPQCWMFFFIISKDKSYWAGINLAKYSFK